MDDFLIKSAKLVSTAGEKHPLILAEVLDLPNNQGSIFALIKILGRKDETRTRIMDVMHDHIKRFHETMQSGTNIPRRFEQVLQAINEDIAKTVQEGRKVPLSDFHAVLGVINKHQVFLTGIGSLSALFMHRTARQRYVIYELDEQFRAGEEPTWQKPFLTVLDGELHPGDVFYTAVRVSSREISLGELQDILVMLPPSGALERIQQYLNIGSPYGAIAFRVQEPGQSGPPKKTNPLNSIEQLGQTKDETAVILGEQSPDFRAWVTRLTAPILNKLASPGTRGPKSTFRSLLRALVKLSATVVIFIYSAVKNIGQALIKLAQRLRKLLKKDKTTDTTQETSARENQSSRKLQSIRQKLTTAWSWLYNLPKSSKYIGLGALIVLVIFIGSLSLLGKNKNKKEADEAFQTVVSRIEEKKSAAEASLIYDDDAQARTMLNEAMSLLETLSPDSNSQTDEIQRLKDEINVVLAALQGIQQITVTPLADLSAAGTSASFTSAVTVGDKIYGITSTTELYSYNDLDQKWQKEDSANGSIGSVLHAAEYGSDFVFVDSNQRLGKGNLLFNTLNPVVSGTETLPSADHLATYNASVYVLSAQAQQIVKMQPQGEGFDAGTNWIKVKDSDLSTARGLAIDGDIYILTAKTIAKFASGSEEDFQIDVIDPTFDDPVQIWTGVDNRFIYVLEPAQSRVVVFEKNGNFITQYQANELNDALAMSIAEDKKTIYIVTSTQLLSFTADHLLQ